MITLRRTILQLEGPVVFAKIYYHYNYTSIYCLQYSIAGIIFVADIHSMVISHNRIDFSNNGINAFTFSNYYGDSNTNMFIVIEENSLINLTNNGGQSPMGGVTIGLKNKYNIFDNLPCYFQYVSQKGNLDDEITNGKHLNFSIEIDKDMSVYYLMTHCRWLPGSTFLTSIPIDVNKRFVKNFHLPPKVLFVCINESEQECYTDTLATVYPGQSITVMLLINETAIYERNEPTRYF